MRLALEDFSGVFLYCAAVFYSNGVFFQNTHL